MPSRTELRCADDPWQRRLRAYSCTGTHDVVLQPPNAPSAIDTSARTWYVRMGALGSGNPDLPAPAVVAVRTAYFAAAS